MSAQTGYPSLSLRITPKREELNRVRLWIDETFIEHFPAYKLLANSLKLVVSEWIANILKHQHAESTVIFLQLRSVANQYELVISDDGEPFTDYLNYKKKAVAHLQHEGAILRENGLGLYVITKLFPDWHYLAKHNEQTYNEFVLQLFKVKNKYKPKVALLFDSSASDREPYHHLNERFQLTEFVDTHKLIQAHEDEKFDLIMAELSTEHRRAIALKQQLTMIPSHAVTPFIMINNESVAEQWINQLSIDDYVKKNINRKEFISIIERILIRHKNQKNNFINQFKNNFQLKSKIDVPDRTFGFNFASVKRGVDFGSGDFVLKRTINDKLFIVLGDVMGHGVEAELLYHAYIGYLRGLVFSQNESCNPAKILENLSHLLHHDTILNSTVLTCVVLCLHKNGLIEIANAGQPLPYLIDEQGIKEIDATGRLLGISAIPCYKQQNIKLTKGQKLVLYTDGLIEQGHDMNSRWSHARTMRECLAFTYGRDLKESIHLMAASFDAMTRLQPRDDMLTLMIERTIE